MKKSRSFARNRDGRTAVPPCFAADAARFSPITKGLRHAFFFRHAASGCPSPLSLRTSFSHGRALFGSIRRVLFRSTLCAYYTMQNRLVKQNRRKRGQTVCGDGKKTVPDKTKRRIRLFLDRFAANDPCFHSVHFVTEVDRALPARTMLRFVSLRFGGRSRASRAYHASPQGEASV